MDDAEIARRDQALIVADVPLHARPFRIVTTILDQRGGGELTDRSIWEPVMAAYRRLYPTADFSVPPMLVGGAALRDRFYLVPIMVGYGEFEIEPLKLIDVDSSELQQVWNLERDAVWRALYTVADLWDLAYTISDLDRQNKGATVLWRNASSQIEAMARLLVGARSPDASIESACLAAELAMKGTLTFLGVGETRLIDLRHDLVAAAEEIVGRRPGLSDARFLGAARRLPAYVKSRYSAHGLTRLALNEIALRAQYIAAEAVRRLSDRNLAGELEASGRCPPRSFP